VGSVVLRDRKHLAEDGIIIASAGISMDSGYCQLICGPEIITRGFVFVRESEELIEGLKNVVRDSFYHCEFKHTNDWQYVKNRVKEDLKNHIWQKMKRNPMILPMLLEV
jgi:ribonuclease J